jgi:hypothetical protein
VEDLRTGLGTYADCRGGRGAGLGWVVHKSTAVRQGRAATAAARPFAGVYLRDTSSIRKLVGRVKSFVTRNCSRTV